jgi:hypothetical protein
MLTQVAERLRRSRGGLPVLVLAQHRHYQKAQVAT